jgi:flagellar hook protein FlgE
MLRSLNSGVSAMQQFQGELDVIGNNIANSNTTGFKTARVEFEDALSQTLQGPTPVTPMQIGTGVGTSSITNQFVQGTINRTGGPNDLAISGQGFFIVRNSASGDQFITRAGDFHLDTAGFLVTADGLRVQGYSDSGLTTLGDIQIDNQGAPLSSTAAVAAYSFGSDGKVNVRLTDGTQFVRGQVLLQNCTNPQALVKEGENLYSNWQNACPLAQPSAPETNGLGDIVGTALEMSNVDLANEFSQLITAQRAFQASARIVTTSDEILQEVVNLKR